MYETPLIARDSRPWPPADLATQLAELVSSGRRGEAVELFQTKGVGLPAAVVVQLRNAPFRPALEAMAQTLVYEQTILGDMSLPTELFASVTVPTLVMHGTGSFPWFADAAQAIASALPDGRYLAMEGLTHDLVPALAPPLEEFFAGAESWAWRSPVCPP